MLLTCDRSHKPAGFSNLATTPGDEYWVCGTCKKPTREWLLGQGDTMLNFFRGGPMNGSAYETSALLSTAALALPIIEYNWTPEIIVSPTTGRQARVWVHKDGSDAVVAPAPQAQPEVAPAPSAQEPETVAPAPAPQPITQEDNVAAKKKATASVQDRRTALKLGREALAAEAGISASQLWRLENDKPLKEGTAEAIEEALTRLEAAAAEAEPAADPS